MRKNVLRALKTLLSNCPRKVKVGKKTTKQEIFKIFLAFFINLYYYDMEV